jgi:hypothetical protein
VSDSGGFERTDREILVGIRRDIRYMREQMDRETRATREELKDHENRLRILENFRWWLLGSVFAASTITAVAVKVIFR